MALFYGFFRFCGVCRYFAFLSSFKNKLTRSSQRFVYKSKQTADLNVNKSKKIVCIQFQGPWRSHMPSLSSFLSKLPNFKFSVRLQEVKNWAKTQIQVERPILVAAGFSRKNAALAAAASNGATIVPKYTGTSMTPNFAKKCSIFDFLGSKRIFRTRASDLAPFHKPPLLASLATLDIAFTLIRAICTQFWLKMLAFSTTEASGTFQTNTLKKLKHSLNISKSSLRSVRLEFGVKWSVYDCF